jgi:hypothetical protein
VSICSDSLAGLKALQAVRTTPPSAHQCQKVLNDISTWHAEGLFGVPGHAGVLGNDISDELAMGASVLRFLGPKSAPRVSRRDRWRKVSRCLVIQHYARWRCLGYTQRQARKLILGPCLGAKARFLSNRTQSRAVTGLLTGHNTLRRHLHLLGLLDSPMCRRCVVKEETSAHILWECEALASVRHGVSELLFLGARGH